MVHASFRRVAAAAVLAFTLAAAAPGGVTTRDFRIETDQTNSNLNDGNFSMPHRVKFFRPGTDVVGDSATGNYKAGTVTITGNVVMHDTGQSAGPAGGAPSGPSTLSCTELQVDSKRKVYIATGNVVYVQGTRRATAQSARLDQGAHTLDLTGDVRLADGEQSLAAQTVHYNTLTKDVSTSGNPVTVIRPAPPPPGGARPAPARSGVTAPSGALLPGQSSSTLPTPAPAAKATSKPK